MIPIPKVDFRCVRCDLKTQIHWEDHFPKDTKCVKGHCFECYEKVGYVDDVFINEADYELILAKENPNQLALL